MRVTRLLPFLASLLIVFIVGCAQRETDIGSGAIPVSPEAVDGQTTILATHSGEWDLDLSPGQGTYLQIGEAEAFSAVSVLRFATEGLLPDSFEIPEDSARIRFRVDRLYPGRGMSDDLLILIRQITEPWDEDSLIEGVLAGYDTLFDIIDTLPIPTQTGAEETIYWPVPDSILDDWLVEDSLNHGIMLQAVNPGVIVGFQSGEGADSFMVQLELSGMRHTADSGSLEWSDTLFATDDGYLATDFSIPDSGRIRISQGSYRRALLYFPLDSIISNPLRTPVRAWIHLYADLGHDSSLVYTGSNFLYKDASLVDTDWFEYNEPDSARQSFVAVSSSSFGSDNVGISFEITNVLASLVGHPETNGGFSIQATLESSVLSRQYFHAHDSDEDSLRPRLEVWWVEQ